MRIEKRTLEVKQVEVRQVTTLCDMCKRDVEDVSGGDGEVIGPQEVEISASIGMCQPYEGGDQRDFYKIDCCHLCFLARIIPLFRAEGIEFAKKDNRDKYSSDVINDRRANAPVLPRAQELVKTEMYVFALQQGNGLIHYFEIVRAGIGFKWVPSITTDCLLTKEQVQACLELYPVLQQARALRCNLFRENP